MRLVTLPGKNPKKNTSPIPDKTFGKINDRYELAGVIGRGGMGTVYLAKDLTDNSEVVVKIREKSARKTSRKRITSEIEALKEVNHKNLVTLKDSGIVGEKAYVVMELMVGLDLRMYLERVGTAPWASARHILSESCEGLGAMHSKGIVHKDVKPENIFLTVDGTIKVFDFDLSFFTRFGDKHAPGMIYGTPALLPPEQIRGMPTDLRGDIYSLGVVMYTTLCGQYPFTGERTIQILYQIRNHEPPPPSWVAPEAGIPKGADEIVAKAMAKDPDMRFNSMQEMRDAILNIERGISGLMYNGPGLNFGVFSRDFHNIAITQTMPLITEKMPAQDLELLLQA